MVFIRGVICKKIVFFSSLKEKEKKTLKWRHQNNHEYNNRWSSPLQLLHKVNQVFGRFQIILLGVHRYALYEVNTTTMLKFVNISKEIFSITLMKSNVCRKNHFRASKIATINIHRCFEILVLKNQNRKNKIKVRMSQNQCSLFQCEHKL